MYLTSLYCCVSSHGINELRQRFRTVKGIHKCQSFDIARSERLRAAADICGIVAAAALGRVRGSFFLSTPLRSHAPRSAARTPFGSTGAAWPRARHRGTDPETPGTLAEAFAGKGAGPACDAYAVSKELPARRLTRVVSEQLNLQNVRVASGAELFLEFLHRKAHLVGEAALDHGRSVAIRLIKKMHVIWFDDQVVKVALTAHGEIVHTDYFHRCWQGHRASWPVGVGIVEPTLYPDSG